MDLQTMREEELRAWVLLVLSRAFHWMVAPMIRPAAPLRKNQMPGYSSWLHMNGRCYNPNNKKYYNYGARGITVCKRWRKSFLDFMSDMGPKPAGTTIDRINGSGNYEPGNCRWATPAQQSRNTSRNILIEFRGITKPLCTWAEEIGMNQCTLWSRIRELGWSVERALTEKTREW